MTSRGAMIWGALLAAAAVALGAYGAHGLEKKLLALGFEADLAKRMDWFQTGVKYHLYHALGMIVVAIILERSGPSKVLWLVPAFFLNGILLFSGSLYAMTMLSASWSKLGAVVPLGGASFIVGWILLAIGSRVTSDGAS
ncbi:MAG: DUF423 domain-containing protein [Bythopirellula sp.]|nr:DUF423 domain-containing protein [Bythopirellula sp.]